MKNKDLLSLKKNIIKFVKVSFNTFSNQVEIVFLILSLPEICFGYKEAATLKSLKISSKHKVTT